jgi:hypothetical protein
MCGELAERALIGPKPAILFGDRGLEGRKGIV